MRRRQPGAHRLPVKLWLFDSRWNLARFVAANRVPAREDAPSDVRVAAFRSIVSTELINVAATSSRVVSQNNGRQTLSRLLISE
jgi:hypothetical protein